MTKSKNFNLFIHCVLTSNYWIISSSSSKATTFGFAWCNQYNIHHCNSYIGQTSAGDGISVKYCVTANASDGYYYNINEIHDRKLIHRRNDTQRLIYYDSPSTSWKILGQDNNGDLIHIQASCNESDIYNCKRGIEFETCSNVSWNQADVFSDNFILVQKFLNFSDANQYCKETYITSLASIHHSIQNEEAAQLCISSKFYEQSPESSRCWIGLNDIEMERGISKTGWEWIDNSSTDYYAWFSVMPGNHSMNADCVSISSFMGTGGWSDIDCNLHKQFLCNGVQPTPLHHTHHQILP